MGGTQFEVLEKRRVVPDLRAVDPRFRPLLEKMLQPNPADRPDSMAAVAAWRPGAEPQTPPRRAAPTRDRSQAARPAAPAQSKPMLGRRLTKIAVALTLLLGAGSAVFYFPTDFFSSQINPPPQPPIIRPTPGPVPAPPTDLRQRITEFLDTYNGGGCFYVGHVTIEGGDARLEGLGVSQTPFDALYSEFVRQFGGDPTIAWGPVTPEQCPAVNFLSRTKNEPGVAPWLDIDAAALPNGGLRITGSIAEFADRYVELVLISDDGIVSKLMEPLKQSGNIKTFSFGLVKENLGSPPGQLLFVVASSKPLEALKLPPAGLPAEQVFTRTLAEKLQARQTVNVGWRYFRLEK
jgi:serine/threonine-protein kinase